MPPIPMPDEDAKAIAEFIHSMTALSPRQGMPPPSETPVVLNVLVGDATAGAAYFSAKCGTCHSATGDLQGIATQNPGCQGAAELLGVGRRGRRPRRERRRSRGGSGRAEPARRHRDRDTGARRKGRGPAAPHRRLPRLAGAGRRHGAAASRRTGAVPKVEIRDPLEPHHKLLAVYTDKDMHDVTAYLATLK